MPDKEAKKPPKPKRINIEFPKDLEAVYANVAFISHTPAEIIVDFAQVLPRIPKGNVMKPVGALVLARSQSPC